MKNEFKALLIEGMEHYGAEPGSQIIEKFLKYKDLLKEWNEKINLTAIEDDRDIVIKHFIDSVSVLPFLKDCKSMIDIGTGAGFPGIPVKIILGHIDVVLLDSLKKRINFLDTVINEMSLKGICALHGRAEDFGNDRRYREFFDVAVARAVASLPVLLEYCMPFVKTGGIFIAMKGSSIEEVNLSKKALSILGGELEKVEQFTLPFDDIKRSIIVVRKLRQTPTKYPRKAGKPLKEPLI